MCSTRTGFDGLTDEEEGEMRQEVAQVDINSRRHPAVAMETCKQTPADTDAIRGSVFFFFLSRIDVQKLLLVLLKKMQLLGYFQKGRT